MPSFVTLARTLMIALLLTSGCKSDTGGGKSGVDAGVDGSAGSSIGAAGSGAGTGTGSGGAGDAADGGGAGTHGRGDQDGGAGSGSAGNSGGSGGTGGGLSFKCNDDMPNVTAPSSAWVNATGNLASMKSECGNLGLVSANPCSSMVIAGVAQAGLWASEDGGKHWSKLGSGAGSAEITNRISAVVYDPDHPGTFWESGIYNGGGVYKTTDSGQTFVQLGSVTHNDSISVDFTDPDRKTLLVGPHEATSKLYRSTDGGNTWSDIGAGLPSNAGFCTATQVLSANNLLVGCVGGGVFHSSNGTQWTAVGSKGVEPQPLLASDGTIYWLGSQGSVEVSTDHGEHFNEVADGNVAPGIVGSAYPAELPDGRIVVVGKDHLMISSDKGASWKPIGEPLPYPGGGYNGARGPAYSARTKTFYIWRWDCGEVVLPDAIMSAGFDYTKE